MRYVVRILLVAVVSAGTSRADDTIPIAVSQYAQEIDAVMKAAPPVSLEGAYTKGVSAADALVHGGLEQFDEATYRKLQNMMTGFFVSRDETIRAGPVPDFFLKLAREKGTVVDQEFFALLKETYPENYSPAYYRNLTDYAGCVVFEGKTLTTLYAAWSGFQKSHPEQYEDAAEKERKAIESALMTTCVCGTQDSFIREIDLFLKSSPASRIAEQVASRLQSVRSGNSEVQFNCEPR
jgi:hypothetical protein